MRIVNRRAVVGWCVLLTFILGNVALADDAKPASAADPKPAGSEVTLKGAGVYAEELWKPAKGGTPSKTPAICAIEGTPEVAAALEGIMKEDWPGDSIDADQAVKMQTHFCERLLYYVTPNDVLAAHMKDFSGHNEPLSLTGVISEKDGKKWITARVVIKSRDPSNNMPIKVTYPEKMQMPDKPLARAGTIPLNLKVSDTLSLKCILLPAGTFFMGEPDYLVQRYPDTKPFVVTLTKPFYLAENPVTQEMWESVMGDNPSTQVGPQIPVQNISWPGVQQFCQALSEKNGRKVRLPTEAEWEYAARVGTSNPPMTERCKDQISAGKGALLPVKSRKPNAWGLYDMPSVMWEMTCDAWQLNRDKDVVDPFYSTEAGDKAGKGAGHWGKGLVSLGGWSLANHEGVKNVCPAPSSGYNNRKFRILVEATPEEVAEMAKATKK